MKAILDYLKARLAEGSTRVGIVTAILGAVGVGATAADVENIAGTIGFLVGLIAAAWPDKKKKEE